MMPRFLAIKIAESKFPYLQQKLKTAAKLGVPPTVYLNVSGIYAREELYWDDVSGDWKYRPISQDYRTKLDRFLEVGYQMYLDSMCPKCGVPIWYGRSEHQHIDFKVYDTICYGCEKLETEQEDRNTKDKNVKGATILVSPTAFDGMELPDPWEAYERVPG